MCGIAGIFNYRSGLLRPVDGDVLRRMCGLMKHRGPDDEGYYLSRDSSVGLGMRRLAIIDLSTGRQPIHNEDESIWLVLNGEIYNFKELRKELESRGHRFYTNTDTETIVHLYEDYGTGCVGKLRGMFAFALWDEREKKLFIARDRIGKKPLYYTTLKNGSFIFASEIKALLPALSSEKPDISYRAIDLYLTYQYIPSPYTIFEGVNSLAPAHTLVVSREHPDVKTERYWDVDFRRKTKDMSFGDACRKTREILQEATELRMVADVPLGAFLSGGHDSSIVVGLMSRISTRPVKTFSIGFEEEDFSELPYARLAAKHFGTEHNEFVVRPNFIELLPGIVRHYGQPFADSSALPSYVVSRETRRYVTVALNGDGGDETFGGYLRYKAMKGSLYLSWIFSLLGRDITRWISELIPHTETTRGRNIFRYISRAVSALAEPPEMRHIYWHCIFNAEARRGLYTSGMKDNLIKVYLSDKTQCELTALSYNYLKDIFCRADAAPDILDREFYTDIMTYLPECLLVKMDIASMANSLEARSPFLDHKVIEFSASLPSSWKIRGLNTKYILKKTFKDFLPPEIINRPKQGFGIPVGKWFRTSWKNYFREVVISPRAVQRGYFDKGYLEKIFNEHVSGVRDHGYRMWSLLVLELWHRIYIDGGEL